MPDDSPEREERRGIAEPVTSEGGVPDEPGPELDRLPPPAFPSDTPGDRRRRTQRASLQPEGDDEAEGVPFDAFISPDDPIRKEARGIPDDAFISPDDPMVAVDRDESGRVAREAPEKAGGKSRSSGPHAERDRPTIHELPYLLSQLAERLHDAGEGALEVHPDTGHFQAALRSFLRGYLAGGRGGAAD